MLAGSLKAASRARIRQVPSGWDVIDVSVPRAPYCLACICYYHDEPTHSRVKTVELSVGGAGPQEDVEAAAGRILIKKTYLGDMSGSGSGQMISKRTENGTAIYYAIEEFTGSFLRNSTLLPVMHVARSMSRMKL